MLTGRKLISRANDNTDYISLADVKNWLRVLDHDLEDSLITSLLSSAINQVSNYLGYSPVEATVKYGFDSLVGLPATLNPFFATPIVTGNFLRVPSKVISVESVQYLDSNETLQNLDYVDCTNEMSNFVLTISVNSAPSSLSQSRTKYFVEVVEGWGISDFPDDIKTAILLLVSQYYDNRQSIIIGATANEMPYGLTFLLDPYKSIQFA